MGAAFTNTEQLQNCHTSILPPPVQSWLQLHDDILIKLSLMQMQDDEIQRVLIAIESSEAEAVYASYKARSGDRIKHHMASADEPNIF